MSTASFALLPQRGILAVSGSDRHGFLQGLVSNDVEKLAADRAAYAALLTAQGKYLHDFFMLERDGAIWLDTEAARLADLKRRLSMYRLRAKVEIAERPELGVAAIFGPAALSALGLPDEPGAVRSWEGGVALVDPRLAELGARVILDRSRLARLAVSGLAETDFAAYDRHRLALGVPDGSRDLIPEKSILLEAGFDELNGVDWRKGCYVGQELTARTKYRGLIKKRLFPVRIDGPPPEPGAIITLGGKEAGEMRSAGEGIGLALLRLEALAEQSPLAADSATLTPLRPDWVRLDTEPAATASEGRPESASPGTVGDREGT
ncbi:MAG: folate-binding protein YgfZ [Alphaproteobacteria bacterium]